MQASILARIGLGFLFALVAATAVEARVIDIVINESKGVDANVDYAKLTAIGPWDDRNYALTAADLAVLSPHETDSHDPTPAFFRVWMRKDAMANGHPLPTSGPDQYPRSAVNVFLAKFEGLQIDGKIYRGINRIEGNTFEVFDEEELEEMGQTWPKFFSGEVKITTPVGAEETAISVNPVNTNYVIAGSNGPGSGQKMWRSTDGGQTWSGAISLTGSTCCDASVGWSTDGLIAYTSTLINCGSSCGVAFYRSTDKGLTWTQSATLVASGSDKEYLHVDSFPGSPYKDNIYVSWHQSNVQKFARSTDKGLTFSTPQTLDSAFLGIGSDIASDKLGNVYYFFPSTGGSQIRMVKSTDGGATFAASGVKVAATQASFDFPLPSMSTRNAFIYVAADADLSNGPYANSIYVAWPDTYGPEGTVSTNHARVQVGYSRDGGATWTVTTPHPTSDGQTVDRYQQWMKVDEYGRVHVVYYDTRHSANRTGVDVYYSVSLDGAQTWETPRRLTTATSLKLNTSMEWGDYNGMDMAMNDIIAIYTDNRTNTTGDVWGIAGFADAPGPDFKVAVPMATQYVCAGSPLPQITTTVSSMVGYSRPVTLSLPSLNGAVFSGGMFTPGTVTPPADGSITSVLTLGTQPGAANGTYTVTVRGTDNQPTAVVKDTAFNVQVASGQPVVPALTFPANGASGTQRQPVFTWTADAAAVNYTIEIASDAAFTTIVETGTPSAATYTPTAPLAPMTTYYWRVRANSPCGNSAVSGVYSFTTGVTFPEPYCAVTFPSSVEPITRVKFTGIDNPSSAAVGGSPALEDFLSVTGGAASPGSTYPMVVEGNTDGSYTTKVKAFIDWNHNGVFDASEGYVIGDLINSTGVDGKQVTANVAVPAGALSGPTRMRVIKKYSTAPVACETAGYGQAEDYTLSVAPAGPTYTVGGTVTGLAGSGLALKLNGGTGLPVAADGAFTFPDNLPSSTAYAVTVGTQPSGQSCAVANGSGTIGSANVTNVAVTCATLPTYTVGGTVSGLTGSGFALKLNGGAALAISANGGFAFPDGLTSGAAYTVAVSAQPSSPVQTCSVANGSGTMGGANVNDVSVTCIDGTPPTYTIGGSVSGLAGSGLLLKLNGGTALPVAADGAFAFPDSLIAGTAYVVTIGAQPSNPAQTCGIANASGTIGSANVTNVAVTCVTGTPTSFTVGGTVTGLVGSGLKLKLNNGSNLVISSNGAFVFTTQLATGASYVVAVTNQPGDQTCTITNDSGTIGTANVTDVAVSCATSITDRIFADGFEGPATP